MNWANSTAFPQFAGDRRLPKGWASISDLYGKLLIGLIKEIYAASDDPGRSAIVLYACEKSSDHASNWRAPRIVFKRIRAANESKACGQ